MNIFENLVEEATQKNQTIKVLSYIYKKVIYELVEVSLHYYHYAY